MPRVPVALASGPPAGMDDDGKALWAKLEATGQQQLLHFWVELSPERKAALKADIESLDLEQVQRWFTRTHESPASKQHAALSAVPDERVANCTAAEASAEMLAWERTGLDVVGGSKLAVLLMAGGQGTRLGSSNPKGMFPLGLPSGATLFHLQALRIRRLEKMAEAQTGSACTVPWYIMTSGATGPGTEAFFKEHDYFGIEPGNVIFFEQGEIPCLLTNGKMLLSEKHKIARSPDGNGGLYSALTRSGCVADMEKRGIQYVHIYGVDNVLVKVGDPRFLGFCAEKGVEVGAKCVVKKEPTEKVGLICMQGDRYEVMEYSEITPEAMEQRRPDGGLVFNAGNIVQHLYTFDFLKKSCELEDTLKHHVASKKLPYVDESGAVIRPEEPNGIKLEKFVFDVFRLAGSLAVVQVAREAEFSPLKNASAAGKDCVETCRRDLYALNRAYLKAAGVTFVADGAEIPAGELSEAHVCEISPMVSFHGEGLEEVVKASPRMSFPINLMP